jgi:homoserine dehydrogenase
MKTIYAGLIGFGNIGSGTVKLLMENGGLIEKRIGAKIVIKRIADLDLKTPRPVAVDRKLLTRDAKAILNDPEISIVIELVGGTEPAKSFILEAIRQGKHVVTANKALLATHGDEIFKAAEDRGVDIGFEASVGGTIPVIKTLRESLAANRVRSIFSILNGTTNFILTKMSDEGKNYKTVLREAQSLGFAEADPTFDVEGIDTAHKLGIVLSLSYGKRVRLDDIYREGITGVSQQDIEFAKELGYKIKLLAIVNSNYNALHIRGDASGAVFLYGQGSGMMPTASAVVADLIDIARNIQKGISRRVPSRSLSEGGIEEIDLMPMDEIVTNYYFRFSALDRPGVLSRISGILGKYNISIASVIQKGRAPDRTGSVPVVMTTHESREKDMRAALKEIDRLAVLKGKTVRIRIEDDRLK